jgi:hypothetical protein
MMLGGASHPLELEELLHLVLPPVQEAHGLGVAPLRIHHDTDDVSIVARLGADSTVGHADDLDVRARIGGTQELAVDAAVGGLGNDAMEAWVTAAGA